MEYRRVHLVGCEGVGMSALAHILLKRGVQVTGSDLHPGDYSQHLKQQGAHIVCGHQAENVSSGTDLVVISAAIPESNPEVQEARRRQLPVLKYAEMLGQISHCKDTIAVAGTHGKSTTSGMTAYLLHQANFDPTFVIGAKVRQLGGNAGVGNGPFVVEACEYDRSFLNLFPTIAVITNIEPDHLDYYKDIQEIGQAFDTFANKVPKHGLIVIAQEAVKYLSKEISAPVQTYSIQQPAEWTISDLENNGNTYKFRALHHQQDMGQFEIILPGIHNVSNALAVIAVGYHLGIEKTVLQSALKQYTGVHRRFEVLTTSPITLIDDYAHHPTKIKAVLSGVFDRCRYNKLWCVFQPHQASRTYHLFDEFCTSFGIADEIIVTDIFYARDSEAYRKKVNSAQLVDGICKQGKSAKYIATFADVQKYLESNWQCGDLVITIGAGTITQLAQQLADSIANLDCTKNVAVSTTAQA